METVGAKNDAVATEMLRATHALCTWPDASMVGADFLKWSPPWIKQRIGGGTLTNETDGANCPVHHPN